MTRHYRSGKHRHRKDIHSDREKPKTTSESILKREREQLPVCHYDILRYRFHHGIDFGEIFSFEEPKPNGLSEGYGVNSSIWSAELAYVSASKAALGAYAARQKCEDRWGSLFPYHSIHKFATAGHFTTVRISLGHFNLGPNFCQGTPFADTASIYTNAWSYVKALLKRFGNAGVGVLLALRCDGLMKKASHHGRLSTSSSARTATDPRYSAILLLKCAKFLFQEAKAIPNAVVGVEFPFHSATYTFDASDGAHTTIPYMDMLEMIEQCSLGVPMYLRMEPTMTRDIDEQIFDMVQFIRRKNQRPSVKVILHGPNRKPRSQRSQKYGARGHMERRYKAQRRKALIAIVNLSTIQWGDGAILGACQKVDQALERVNVSEADQFPGTVADIVIMLPKCGHVPRNCYKNLAGIFTPLPLSDSNFYEFDSGAKLPLFPRSGCRSKHKPYPWHLGSSKHLISPYLTRSLRRKNQYRDSLRNHKKHCNVAAEQSHPPH